MRMQQPVDVQQNQVVFVGRILILYHQLPVGVLVPLPFPGIQHQGFVIGN